MQETVDYAENLDLFFPTIPASIPGAKVQKNEELVGGLDGLLQLHGFTEMRL